MCPTYHMCCHIFGVFDFCEVTATKIRHRAVGPMAVGRGPICPPKDFGWSFNPISYLNQFFIFEGGGVNYAHLITTPPQIFRPSYDPDSA